MTDKGAPDLFESEILEFSEPRPGVFIPMKCRQQSTRNGERVHFEEVTLSEVQVNKPIPESVFELPAVPSGTVLYDRIQRTRYPIDSDWQRIGPSRSLLQLTMPAPSDSRGSDYRSHRAAKPIRRWVISVSSIVVLVVCVYVLYRRHRSQRA